jgi:hypothetical protein
LPVDPIGEKEERSFTRTDVLDFSKPIWGRKESCALAVIEINNSSMLVNTGGFI